MRPWERQDGESASAYRAARAFFEQGADRSLAAVTRAIGPAQGGEAGDRRGASGIVKAWAKRHRWRERAQAYDRNLHKIEDRAIATERADQATTLERRRAQVAETGWEVAQRLIARRREMLTWPLAVETSETTVSEDGRTTTIIIHRHPAGWRLRDAIGFLKLGMDLAYLSLGLPNRVAAPRYAPAKADAPAVDQVAADADNGRVPQDLAADWLDLASRRALEHEGIADAQPVG